jgi:DinB superfamily
MTNDERQKKIELYGRAYDILEKALRQFPRDMWTFKPSPDLWSIHEIVVHVTDSEANSFVRCRRLVAEPGSMVLGYDENAWARLLHYQEQSTEDALQLFRWLRLTSFKLIQALPESTWAHTVEHTENGTMTMDDWLDVYARHIPDHVAQMQGVYEQWKRQAKPA